MKKLVISITLNIIFVITIITLVAIKADNTKALNSTKSQLSIFKSYYKNNKDYEAYKETFLELKSSGIDETDLYKSEEYYNMKNSEKALLRAEKNAEINYL